MARPKNTDGNIVDVQKGTFGKLVINRNHNLYFKYIALRSDTKSIFDNMLTYMQSETNLITLKGDILQAVIKDSNYAERTIVNAINELKKLKLVEITHQLPHELVVNPIFAIKDNNDYSVWKTYQSIQYEGNVPLIAISWSLYEE